MESSSTQTYSHLSRAISRLSNDQLLKFSAILVIHIHWKRPVINQDLTFLICQDYILKSIKMDIKFLAQPMPKYIRQFKDNYVDAG